MPKHKNTIIGISFIKAIAEKGYRIFDIEKARELGKEFSINPAYMKQCLHILKQQGWINTLRPGLYALCPPLLSGSPVSEYEIAMSITDPATICYWSAMHYHQLTQQIPHKIFVLTTTDAKLPKSLVGKDREISINNIRYHFLSIKKEHYFGVKKVWIGDARINITDLERTLVDMLSRPKYCGGFGEVIEGFMIASDKIDLPKIIEYAKKMGVSTVRRLGWVLECINTPSKTIKELENSYKGYIKLNASGANEGSFNKKWGIRVNI